MNSNRSRHSLLAMGRAYRIADGALGKCFRAEISTQPILERSDGLYVLWRTRIAS